MTRIRDKEFCQATGQEIKRIRKAKGLSQYELAHGANINRSQIIRIENGEINTTLSSIKAIANALGKEPFELLKFDLQRPETL